MRLLPERGSFTFIRPNLAAGGHDVRLQWILSGPGEGRVNDRTLNVAAIQNAGSNLAGALMSAAPTGVAQSTTSTSWVDVPDLTGSITTPAGGDLTMTFSGEFAATAGKRVFLRALVDGQPTRPSDVRLFSGGWHGSYAYSFVAPNVDPGSHTIQLQWLTDTGSTASVGDRTLAVYSYARPNQADWSPLPPLNSLTSPAISSHSDGRLYVAAITVDGHMYATSSESPRGWEPWQSVGPEHNCPSMPCNDPAYHFDPLTPPVFLWQGQTLTLLARGADDNLYETHRIDNNPWSNWQQLTTDGQVLGRISVAFTQSDGAEIFHIVHVGLNDTVRYRRFNSAWVQQGAAEQWSQAAEGVIASDGVNEVWAVIRTTGQNLLVEEKNRPWSSSWHSVASRTAPGAQGAYFDISNLVYFGGAYHLAYSSRFLDQNLTYQYTLLHARFRAGLPDDGHEQLVRAYTPQSNSFPRAELAVYRNKLVIAYQDELGDIRYARWDNADPTTPWLGNEIVSSGSTDQRPALAVFNRRPSFTENDYAVPNFGNDLFAAVNNAGDNRLSYVNFSRAIFIQAIQAQFDVYDLHTDTYDSNNDGTLEVCQDQTHPLAPTLIDDIAKDGRPFYTELGYNLWVLPSWLASHIFKDGGYFGVVNGDTSGRFNLPANQAKFPIIITGGPIFECSGSWLNQAGDFRSAWQELGHAMLEGPFGFDDPPENNPPAAANASATGINLSDLLSGFEIFGRYVNGARSCLVGTAPGGRCRGFTGFANNYDVGTRQHSFMYVLHYWYAGYGDELRTWVQDDLASGQTLLQEKYEWSKQNIYHGIEFRNDAEPLVRLLNDAFETATVINAAPFAWDEDAAEASTDGTDPLIACGAQVHGETVWFQYIPSSNGMLSASTSGSQYDTVLAVWTGQKGALAPVGCNNDASPTDFTSSLQVSVKAGTPVYFEIASVGGNPASQLKFQLSGQTTQVFLPLISR